MASSRFKPGQSGNPAGRKKGSRNHITKLLAALEKDLPQLIAAVKARALEGDTAALRLLLERLIPTKKSESSLVVIENIDSAKTLTEKSTLIMDAIANGRIPPDVGSSLISALGNTAKIMEIDDLQKRVEALEESDN